MTLVELARLVAGMRVAQRMFSHTRKSADLAASRALERDLDRAVEDILKGHGQLFGDRS